MAIDSGGRFHPELYRSYLVVCARVCVRTLGPLRSKLDASDLVQDALLRAHTALPQFRGATEPQFTAWLRTILETTLLDKLKHHARARRDAKREQAFGDSIRESSVRCANRLERIAADGPSPSQQVVRNERARLLADALMTLPEDQRTALELHYLEDRPLREAAAMMQRTTASVAGLLRRGLAEMRGHLKGLEHDLR